MPFQPDSRTPGYLGPSGPPAPAPIEGDAWTDFLCAAVAGITGLDPDNLVRPRWQEVPPVVPDRSVSWVAVGVMSTTADWQPAVIHVSTGDGYDDFQRFEESTVLCSFYGPDAQANASLLRDGLFIDQNMAAFRSVSVGLVEVGEFAHTPELFRNQWRDRVDMNMVIRREVRRNYPVLNLLSARGTITANRPNGDPTTISDSWDTTHSI